MSIILTLIRQFWPYLVAFSIGASLAGSSAWTVQGYRLTAARQEFTNYQQEQTRVFQEAQHHADLQRNEANQAYERASQQLKNSVLAGDVYRRCVAAGKCGMRQPATCAGGIRLPPAGVADATRTDPVPATGDPAAAEPVVGECAETTLRLNQLQADIERQPGY